MLLNLHKRGWTEGLKLRDFEEMKEGNEAALKVSTSSPSDDGSMLTVTSSKCSLLLRHTPNRFRKRLL